MLYSYSSAKEVLTSKVSQIIEELCGTRFSKDIVSELCNNLNLIIEGSTKRATFRWPVSFLTGRCHVPKS